MISPKLQRFSRWAAAETLGNEADGIKAQTGPTYPDVERWGWAALQWGLWPAIAQQQAPCDMSHLLCVCLRPPASVMENLNPFLCPPYKLYKEINSISLHSALALLKQQSNDYSLCTFWKWIYLCKANWVFWEDQETFWQLPFIAYALGPYSFQTAQRWLLSSFCRWKNRNKGWVTWVINIKQVTGLKSKEIGLI